MNRADATTRDYSTRRAEATHRAVPARAAEYAFCVLAAVAVAWYLVLGRHGWFFLDDWDFLVSRSAGSANDLFRPHNQHWTTLPILVWRAIWQAVGLRSYVPYELVSVLLHVVVAALGRAVMRRMGVRSWIATGAAGAFLYFGSGSQNILSAFQIAFTGALALGLAQLLLADHDGPIGRRDWLGLCAGALGLMCSGVAVAMVAVVGVATLLRRGPKAAAFHAAPLLAMYLAWYGLWGGSGTKFTGTPSHAIAFARAGIGATFAALGQVEGVGLVLGVSMLVGVALLCATGDGTACRARLALPVALLVGVVVFFVTAAVGRTSGQSVVELPDQSRFVYVGAALLMPVIALAVEVIGRRSASLGTLVAVAILAGVPGNAASASSYANVQTSLVTGSRSVVLSIAQLPLSARVPGSLRPDPVGAPAVTIGWLRAQQRSERLPSSGTPSAALLASDRLRLSLMEVDARSRGSCPPLTGPVVRHLGMGQRVDIGDGAVTITERSASGPAGVITLGNLLFHSSRQGHVLVSVVPDLDVTFAPTAGHRSELC